MATKKKANKFFWTWTWTDFSSSPPFLFRSFALSLSLSLSLSLVFSFTCCIFCSAFSPWSFLLSFPFLLLFLRSWPPLLASFFVHLFILSLFPLSLSLSFSLSLALFFSSAIPAFFQINFIHTHGRNFVFFDCVRCPSSSDTWPPICCLLTIFCDLVCSSFFLPATETARSLSLAHTLLYLVLMFFSTSTFLLFPLFSIICSFFSHFPWRTCTVLLATDHSLLFSFLTWLGCAFTCPGESGISGFCIYFPSLFQFDERLNVATPLPAPLFRDDVLKLRSLSSFCSSLSRSASTLLFSSDDCIDCLQILWHNQFVLLFLLYCHDLPFASSSASSPFSPNLHRLDYKLNDRFFVPFSFFLTVQKFFFFVLLLLSLPPSNVPEKDAQSVFQFFIPKNSASHYSPAFKSTAFAGQS